MQKLTACLLVFVLGLSSNVYTILAIEITDETKTVISSVQERDTSTGLIKDKDNTKDTEQNKETTDIVYTQTNKLTTQQNISAYTRPEGVEIDGYGWAVEGIDYHWEFIDGMSVLVKTTAEPIEITTYGTPQEFRIEIRGDDGGGWISFKDCIMRNYSENPAITLDGEWIPMGFHGDNAFYSSTMFNISQPGNDSYAYMNVTSGSLILGGPFLKTNLGSNARMWSNVGNRHLLSWHTEDEWQEIFQVNLTDRESGKPRERRVNSNQIVVESPEIPVLGRWEYSTDGLEWNTTGVFEGLVPNTPYTIYTRRALNGIELARTNNIVVSTLPQPKYEITIPAEMRIEDKNFISPASGENFDIPIFGQVNVTMTSGGSVTNNGEIILTRNGCTDTVSTYLQVGEGEERFTNINNNVATFTMDNQTPVPISFEEPTRISGPILAGSYTGTVTFKISYSEQ